MATYSKEILSGSTNGKQIPIAATGGTGTLIHTTGTSTSTKDEVWIYASNIDTIQQDLTIQYGGSATGDTLKVGIPASAGLSIIIPGTILTGNGSTGSEIRATATAANIINVTGYINRIVP